MNLIADHESGLILYYGLAQRFEASEDMVEGLLKLIEAHNVVPSMLVSVDEKVFDALAPVIIGYGLECRLEPKLPAIEEFQQTMMRGQMF